ncbi:MoaD family protein [Pelotomaculum propionicicum]|uniref:Sulfur carrier protein CysO n=1 Tax=Pelotomaculum propionicicum TaxID=258475 RepID=A0A4Y7RPX5_9FIRM|nr:MoaD family protein [Pelotomaculum propionicicum]NLI12822.1 MoaD/ThiS family protein [Peptococcaceae bacterium]TEB10327.1 hypothetical protein Pmgp_02429 [Pelotomaculum propionicicum]
MITVTVKWLVDFDGFKGARGEESVTLQTQATCRDLLDLLSKSFGSEFTERIFDSEGKELKEELCFLLNGRNIASLKGMESELKDGDRLFIVPFLGGG